jgi:hypothetical protein
MKAFPEGRRRTQYETFSKDFFRSMNLSTSDSSSPTPHNCQLRKGTFFNIEPREPWLLPFTETPCQVPCIHGQFMVSKIITFLTHINSVILTACIILCIQQNTSFRARRLIRSSNRDSESTMFVQCPVWTCHTLLHQEYFRCDLLRTPPTIGVAKHSSQWYNHVTRFFPYGSGIQSSRVRIVRFRMTDTSHRTGTGMLPVKRQSWIYPSCFCTQCRVGTVVRIS